ncbi:alkanesulfonate monooxygenase SsuD/methylene tetrahydromethanopterin reductase-like flavin-dependent oxidoreductase (luciferase family) [Amycolatopsis bartoniae]|uniref:Luciferase n=1 Tax=Amycolatopsis bartoniae TaxID=941986 RepID=A0A8H9MC81_9PSEU|nr:LLM class flavin-dependent oxidoreductase [Amycolatopsis bartoniae]MBB2937881.1 alkanesulfonate monooxygenase SsuD/methylene tetrahydromethanopterin reductase-like flavin-dependent oxidoreductase (luciferase family) [Amycolatopsis bartoniae]TVT01311.1 LLM class flavin-dependent oxidoreductase [Amycolatopsis bartoniae]GHF41421.1 luciferase [Amycolatopsis bartoniae]
MSVHALLIPNVTWPELLAHARRLEELGVTTVWVDDHLLNPAHPGRSWLGAWSVLPALAAATSRIRLGPLVANGVLHPPAVLARHALSVDHISGGRLELGLGSGYAKADLAAGQATEFDTVVSTVDKALRGEPVVDGFPPLAPAGRIPLTIAAHGRRALETAARYGDRWVSYGGFGLDEPTHLARTRRRIAVVDEIRPVRKMLLAGSPAVTAAPIWSSVQAATDFTGRYREAGIDEFTFYYPPSAMWSSPKADEVFEDFVSRQ